MSTETPAKDRDEMRWGIDIELSDRELWSIGKIVALWGSLEYEIFCQTLMCLSDSEISAGHLPKEMNNLRFSQVLAIWETRVVNKAVGTRKVILQEQHESIVRYYDFRNALVHGMWDWDKAAPEKITASRIRRKQILRTHFTADDLASFASDLETINFKVRYPGGLEDYANARMKQGANVSRQFFLLNDKQP